MALSHEAKALLRALRAGDGTIERTALGGWMTPGLFYTEGHIVYSLVQAGIAEYTAYSVGRTRIGVAARLRLKPPSDKEAA